MFYKKEVEMVLVDCKMVGNWWWLVCLVGVVLYLVCYYSLEFWLNKKLCCYGSICRIVGK